MQITIIDSYQQFNYTAIICPKDINGDQDGSLMYPDEWTVFAIEEPDIDILFNTIRSAYLANGTRVGNFLLLRTPDHHGYNNYPNYLAMPRP